MIVATKGAAIRAQDDIGPMDDSPGLILRDIAYLAVADAQCGAHDRIFLQIAIIVNVDECNKILRNYSMLRSIVQR
jgi:hypothetical protein